MKIEAKKFRVRERSRVNLKEWPTRVDPVYKNDAHYEALLREHVAELSDQQTRLYASDDYALLLIFQAHGCRGQGRRDRARHVGRQSAGLPGVQLQAPERRRS